MDNEDNQEAYDEWIFQFLWHPPSIDWLQVDTDWVENLELDRLETFARLLGTVRAATIKALQGK